MKVLIYNEFEHERKPGAAQDMYPEGIHMAIAKGLKKMDEDLTFTYACLQDHKEVITEELLDDTDVMLWWVICITELWTTVWWKRYMRLSIKAWDWWYFTPVTNPRFSNALWEPAAPCIGAKIMRTVIFGC